MPGDNAKVKRYYRRFQKASESLTGYLEEVGEALAEGGYISQASDFLEDLEGRTDARESARLQLERVIREEEVSVGPVVVEHRTSTTYDGEYLYKKFEKEPELRDDLIEVVYKVKPAVFNRLVKEGHVSPKVVDKATVARKRTTALKGMPSKIGLG